MSDCICKGCGCEKNTPAVYSEGVLEVGSEYTGTPEYGRLVHILDSLIKNAMQMKPGDNFTIMSRGADPVALAGYEAAQRNGLNIKFYNITSEEPLTELPKEIEQHFRGVKPEGVLSLFDYAKYGGSEFDRAELPFRISYLLGVIENIPTLCFHVPAEEEIWEMFTKEGNPLDVNYAEGERDARALLGALEGAKKIHVTGEAGTDFTIDVPEDMTFLTDAYFERGEDGLMPNGKPGMIANLPSQEVYNMTDSKGGMVDGEEFEEIPVGFSVTGKLVCDLRSSVGKEMMPEDPSQYLTFHFEDGNVTNIEAEDPMWKDVIDLYGKALTEIVVEEILGTGLNPSADINGKNFVEVEKVKGTSHLAFSMVYRGEDEKLKSIHGDHLFSKPTYEVKYWDDSERTLMQDGELLV